MCQFEHLSVAGRIAERNDLIERTDIELLFDAADLFIAVTVSAQQFPSDLSVFHFKSGGETQYTLLIAPRFHPVFRRCTHDRNCIFLFLKFLNRFQRSRSENTWQYLTGELTAAFIELLQRLAPEVPGKEELLRFPVRNQFQKVEAEDRCEHHHPQPVGSLPVIEFHKFNQSIPGGNGAIEVKERERGGGSWLRCDRRLC